MRLLIALTSLWLCTSGGLIAALIGFAGLLAVVLWVWIGGK